MEHAKILNRKIEMKLINEDLNLSEITINYEDIICIIE